MALWKIFFTFQDMLVSPLGWADLRKLKKGQIEIAAVVILRRSPSVLQLNYWMCQSQLKFCCGGSKSRFTTIKQFSAKLSLSSRSWIVKNDRCMIWPNSNIYLTISWCWPLFSGIPFSTLMKRYYTVKLPFLHLVTHFVQKKNRQILVWKKDQTIICLQIL